VIADVPELALEVPRVPEGGMVGSLAPDRPDQSFDEWVGHRHEGYGLDLCDAQNPEAGLPPVELQERVVIRA
jgi:hypothetical protein